MKKVSIGYIYSGKPEKEERIFLRLAKRKNIELVMVNISKDVDEAKLEEKIRKCRLIFNSTAEDFAVEYAKTMEELGKKVIDSSKVYYYTEDKWMFFLKCREHKIPTPETILLSDNMNVIKGELKKFGHWPVILKRVCGTMGQFVGKAEDINKAVYIINNFWKKGSEKLPIIAQEFITSPSYRVTVIGDRIVQTALKENKSGWKATGVYAKKFKKFKVDRELRKIINKVMKMAGIKICGIDLLKKDGKWLVVEVNSEPALDFFEGERESLVDEVLEFLKRHAG
jgi:RimK family alpha-L-glutamate ligase